MLPDRVSNPGPLTYESGALLIALRGPAEVICKEFNPGWWELPFAGTNFHGPKTVWAIEVLLYVRLIIKSKVSAS